MRPDGKSLPVGYIPNGSGGMMSYETGSYGVEGALNTIVSRTVTKMTVIEAMVDTDDRSSIPPGFEGFKTTRRFCLLGGFMGNFWNRMFVSAIPFKKYIGNVAYLLSIMKYMSCSVKKYREKYEVTLDGVDQGSVISQFV